MGGSSSDAAAPGASGDADCDKPVCAVKGDMFSMMKKVAKNNSEVGTPASSGASSSSANRPCPVDKEELGQGTWALARRFFDALGTLYPCTHCAEDYREDIRSAPPKVESREALSLWVCARHNEVNDKLGKETFPCVLEQLDKRWLKGDSSCWHG